MTTEFVINTVDRFLKPHDWYAYRHLTIKGFELITSKTEQTYAGFLDKPDFATTKTRHFGPNPLKPYRDYYGEFELVSKLYPEPLTVKFAIGYTFNVKVVTVDDYSNFSWLRMAVGMPEILYPNLAHHTQLLNFLIPHAKQPKFIVCRIYHYLQNDIYQEVTRKILENEPINK